MKYKARIISSFLLAFVAVYVGACKKNCTTTIHGTIVDQKTNMPLKGVTVVVREKVSERPFNTLDHNLKTRDDGTFFYESEYPIWISLLSISGYVVKGYGTRIAEIKTCKENEVTIGMLPVDGTLKISLTNNANIFDSIYIGMYSPLLKSEYYSLSGFGGYGPFVVGGSTTKDIVFNLASEQYLQLYWDSTQITSNANAMLLANHDSVYVIPNDTSFFSIVF